ncbi:MAG: hypothetical protein WD042_02795 [Phycisphaeraceae bacterium]
MQRRVTAAAMLFVWLTTGAAQAQPLADRVPEDALLYVGWAGTDTLGKTYEESHLKAVLAEGGVSEFFGRIQTVVTNLASRGGQDPDAAQNLRQVAAMLDLAYRHPTALWLLGNGADEPPKLAIAIQAGDDSDKVLDLLGKLIAKGPQPNPSRVMARKFGDLVVLTAQYADDQPVLADKDATLLQESQFQAALKQVHEKPAWVSYVSATDVWALIDQAVAANPRDDQRARYEQLAQALAFRGVERMITTGAFEGRGWATKTFVAVPAEARKGLAALLTAPALPAEAFKVVPRNVTWAAGVSFSPAQLWETILTTVKAGEPRAQRSFERGMAEFKDNLGFAPDSLINALGNQWVIYSNMGGEGVLPDGVATVLVNQCQDAKAVGEALVAMEARIKAEMEEQAEHTGRPPQVTVTTRQEDGLDIHSFAFPMMMVEWTVIDDKLYVGFGAGGVAVILQQRKAKDSILDSPDFAPLAKRLAGGDVVSATMTDVRKTSVAIYQQMGVLLPMLQFALAQGGGGATPLTLPPLSKLMPHLGVATSVGYVDAAGYHAVTTGKFPGETLLSPGGWMSTSSLSLGVGIALPALGAARRTARQMQDSTQVRGIIQGCILYAQGNAERYPDNVYKLLQGNYMTPEYLLSPLSGKKLPAEYGTWPEDKQRTWINDNMSYVLIPNLTADTDSRRIAAFTKIQDSGGKGISIGYNDNHAEWTPLDKARKLIKEQTGRTLEEWSGVEEKKQQ